MITAAELLLQSSQKKGRYYASSRSVAVDDPEATMGSVEALLEEGFKPYGFLPMLGPFEIEKGYTGLCVYFESSICAVLVPNSDEELVRNFVGRAAAGLGEKRWARRYFW